MNKILATASFILLASLSASPALAAVTHFRAELDASIIQPKTDPDHDQSTATAVADFVLTYDPGDPAATSLSYDIQFNGLDIAPSDGLNLLDDVTAIHIHDTSVCVNAAFCGDGFGGQIPGSTAGTRHVLNIFGAPRADDADVEVFADAERVIGRWDPSDANNLTPAPTQSIADPAILDLLFAGKLALMVHTNLVGSGEIGGFLVQVPEPRATSLALAAVGILIASQRNPRRMLDLTRAQK